jgi:excisionase family DNA binding protein
VIEILTPEEVGELLRLPSNKVVLLARRGELPFVILDGRMRFDANDLEDWIKARKIGSALPPPPRTVTPE